MKPISFNLNFKIINSSHLLLHDHSNSFWIIIRDFSKFAYNKICGFCIFNNYSKEWFSFFGAVFILCVILSSYSSVMNRNVLFLSYGRILLSK
jgi:hypothetical protein